MALEAGGDEVFFRRPEISFRMAISALTVLIFSGVFAGMIPARRAVRIKPIDAIREEK
jgi:putative ABC transport system permease protein